MAIHGTVNNDGGIIKNGGTIASTRFTNSALGQTAYSGNSGLKLGMSNLHRALTSGNFATMVAGEYIMIKVTTTIGGVANTNLLSGGADFGQRHAVHYAENYKTTFLSGLSWAATPEGMPDYTFTTSTSTVEIGTDEAARATMDSPGELVYSLGQTPIQDDYQART